MSAGLILDLLRWRWLPWAFYDEGHLALGWLCVSLHLEAPL